MTKVAITLVSNRPQMIRERWLSSLHNLAGFFKRFDVTCTFQFNDPVGRDIEEAVSQRNWAWANRPPYVGEAFNWVHYKNDACDLARDADYWLCTDDDFRFCSPTPKGYDINERYISGIEYMNANPHCGVLMMKGFLGGSIAKREIVPTKDDIYEIAYGLILRNVSQTWSYAKSYFCLPGALDETAAIFSRVEDGYYIAKAFNTPVAKGPTKHIDEDTPKLAYKPSYINSVGIGALIRSRYFDPAYDHNKRYLPAHLVNMYRVQALMKGYPVVY